MQSLVTRVASRHRLALQDMRDTYVAYSCTFVVIFDVESDSNNVSVLGDTADENPRDFKAF